MAVLGNCPNTHTFSATYTNPIRVNEISTVAAAYALAGFATDSWHISSNGSPLAQTGVLNVYSGTLKVGTVNGAGLQCNWGGAGTSIINVLGGLVSVTGNLTINLNNANNAGNSGIKTCVELARAAVGVVAPDEVALSSEAASDLRPSLPRRAIGRLPDRLIPHDLHKRAVIVIEPTPAPLPCGGGGAAGDDSRGGSGGRSEEGRCRGVGGE